MCVRWKTELLLLSDMYCMTGKGISLQNNGLIESRLIVYYENKAKQLNFFARALNPEQFYRVFLTFTSYFDFFPSTSNFNDNINVFSFETLIFLRTIHISNKTFYSAYTFWLFPNMCLRIVYVDYL